MATVNDLIKAARTAASNHQAAITAAKDTAAAVNATRPNPKPTTTPAATAAAYPTGGAQ